MSREIYTGLAVGFNLLWFTVLGAYIVKPASPGEWVAFAIGYCVGVATVTAAYALSRRNR